MLKGPESPIQLRRVSTVWTLACLLAILLPSLSVAQSSRDPRSEGLRRAVATAASNEDLRISVVLREGELPAKDRAQHSSRIRERQTRILSRMKGKRFEMTHRYRSLNGFAGWATPAAIAALATDPEILSMDVDRKAYASLVQGSLLVGANTVRSMGFTGDGVGVAVLDTGIDTDHPDLSSNLVAEGCWCDNRPGRSGCCPNGRDTQSGTGSGEDDNGHGTQVSGVVASTQSARKGIAPDASIVALKVLDDNGSGSFSDIADALDWIISNHAAYNIKVVNLSLGDGGEYADAAVSPCSGTNTADAIAQLKALGLAVFVASGNEGHDNGISYPACVEEAISVGGVYDASIGSVSWCGATCDTILCTDNSIFADKFVCHTNDGGLLDVLAPDFRTITPTIGGGTTTVGGTSIASPYAAGQAALLFDVDLNLTPDEILTWLTFGSPMVTNPDNSMSYPRTRVDQAVEFLTAVCGDGNLSGGEECDDGNTDPGDCCDSGCQFETDGSACDDADACTDGDICSSGVCSPGPPLACDDANSCTDDGCSSATGCSYTNNTDSCDDGDSCGTDDICADGVCSAGGVLDCDDLDPCTADSCDEIAGCYHDPIAACQPTPAIPGLGIIGRMIVLTTLSTSALWAIGWLRKKEDFTSRS